MADFTIKRGDRLPSLTMTLTDQNGDAVDLTGCTARVLMARRGRTPVVDAEATITSAATGAIEYEWAAGDTAEAGVYQLEVEIEFADGRTMTCPSDGFATVRVTEDLG